MRFSIICLGLFAVTNLLCSGSAHADFEFGTPTNLGLVVNSSSGESPSCISYDGLEMYIDSDRPGQYGNWDIWVSRRPSKDAEWGLPENLGPVINTESEETLASISADGLTLYFNSNRPDGYGKYDIWMTTRPTKESPWGAPENLGSPVNSSDSDGSPWISADGLALYFGSMRSGGYGRHDIWVTRRVSEDSPWEEPVHLGSGVNSENSEIYVSVSSDERLLFFSEWYNGPFLPDGYGDADIWFSTRPTVQGDWSTPINMGSNINGPLNDSGARISPDGRTVYFSSERPGGFGGVYGDIYQAPILPIVDLNSDGIVDAEDMCIMVDNWDTDNPLCDIGPMPWGDGIVDVQDLIVLAEHLFEEYPPIEPVE